MAGAVEVKGKGLVGKNSQVTEKPPSGGGPKAGNMGASGSQTEGRNEKPQDEGKSPKVDKHMAGAKVETKGGLEGDSGSVNAKDDQVKGSKLMAGNPDGKTANRSKRKINRTASRQVNFSQGLPSLNMAGDNPNRTPEQPAKRVLNDSLEKSVEKFTHFLNKIQAPSGTGTSDSQTASTSQSHEEKSSEQEEGPESSGLNQWKTVARKQKSSS